MMEEPFLMIDQFQPKFSESAGGVGDALFPEKRVLAQGAQTHDKVDVEVTIDWGGGAPTTTNVYLRVFDPDHDSSNVSVDPNGNTPNDNVMAGGGSQFPGGVLVPFPRQLAFTAPNAVQRTTLLVYAPQPGNNFVIAASGRQENVDAIVFKDDGKTLLKKPGGAVVPPNVKTHLLTIWRTLHVEQDSMGSPDPDNPWNVFNGPGIITGPNFADDDEFPGDPGGETGTGNFVQPSLQLLTGELLRAHVKVEALSAPVDDPTDNPTFYHYMGAAPGGSLYGDSVRNVASTSEFWSVQVFAAYEHLPEDDFDPVGDEVEPALGGSAIDGTANIYLETLRDISVNFTKPVDGVAVHTVNAETLRQRTVFHEVMHLLGHGPHDIGVMNYDLLMFGTDKQIELAGELVREIMVLGSP